MSVSMLNRGSWAGTAVLALVLAAAPAGAQPAAQVREAAQRREALTPREIAAGASAALLVVHALDAQGDTVGTGTGFAVSADGMFVTNFHVVQEARVLRVSDLEGNVYGQVLLVAADAPHDLALLKVEGRTLRPLRLGSDADAQVGDPVFVMGNPMGMNGTFSDGMVSAKRPVEGVSMIQISAPISAGSSGGPVMNDRGEVIGVATLMLMGGQNINLAVPVRYVRPLMESDAEPRPFAASSLPRRSHAGLASFSGGGGAAEPRREGASATTWEGQVMRQFEAVGGWIDENGYTPTEPVWTGLLERSGTETREVELVAGREYLFTARCDNDCSDVDLGLFAEDGTRVGADIEPDDYPLVLFRPRRSGTYKVVALVSACSASRCGVGVGMYEK